MKTLAITAVAGLTAVASAQGIAVSFEASATEINVGETVDWSVSVFALDFGDETAYLGGFVGDFLASDSGLGTMGGWVSNFSGNATTPTMDGASAMTINSFNAAILGTDDPGLVVAFTWSVTAAAVGELSYTFDGVWSYFESDNILALPLEFTADTAGQSSSVVTIIPAPGALALAGLGVLVAGRRRG